MNANKLMDQIVRGGVLPAIELMPKVGSQRAIMDFALASVNYVQGHFQAAGEYISSAINRNPDFIRSDWFIENVIEKRNIQLVDVVDAHPWFLLQLMYSYRGEPSRACRQL